MRSTDAQLLSCDINYQILSESSRGRYVGYGANHGFEPGVYPIYSLPIADTSPGGPHVGYGANNGFEPNAYPTHYPPFIAINPGIHNLIQSSFSGVSQAGHVANGRFEPGMHPAYSLHIADTSPRVDAQFNSPSIYNPIQFESPEGPDVGYGGNNGFEPNAYYHTHYPPSIANTFPPIGPVVGNGSNSNASYICLWQDGGHRLCGQSIGQSVSRHMTRFHLRRGETHGVVCNWMGCSRRYRRDTISRHIKEVHLGQCRLSSNGSLRAPTI